MGSNLELTDPKPKIKQGYFLSCSRVVLLLCFAVVVVTAVGVGLYFAGKRSCAAKMNPEEEWRSCEVQAQEKGCDISCPHTTSPPVTVSDGITTAPPAPKPKITGFRLNRTTLPIHYNVELRPQVYEQLEKFPFEGSVKMWLNVTEPTYDVTMHSARLTINDTSLEFRERDSAGKLINTTWELDEPRQFLRLNFEHEIPPGLYYFTVNFTGILRKNRVGFYLSSYTEGNITKYLAATQFQRSWARNAFPCFDEPGIKSTFNITLVRRKHYTSLCNMESHPEPREDDWVADVYERTPKMSAYLLAFIVSDFKSKEHRTKKGTLFRLWTRPSYLDQLDYALSVSGRILEFFEEWTGVPYPLKKTDQVAVPKQTWAMENWGLVTYADKFLLYNPKFSSTEEKTLLTRIIAHELAHKWFGNLVTCDWWDDTFLNEGFATFLAPLGVQHVHPTWKMEEDFMKRTQTVMVADGDPSSQPIILNWIESHRETHKAFDTRTYNKGGAILRMIYYFLGEKTMRAGLKKYLLKHQYQSVKMNDLYDALQKQAELDKRVTWAPDTNLSHILETWLDQMGLPLVTVSKTGAGEYEISQKHFLYNRNKTLSYQSPFGKYVWDIPLTYANVSEVTAYQDTRGTLRWIHRNETVRWTGIKGAYQIVNLMEQGFYRVTYDHQTWREIIQQLYSNHKVIPPFNRAQIIDDAFNLVEAGLENELFALELTNYLRNETEYLPWWNVLVGRPVVRNMEDMFYNTPTYEHYITYFYKLVTEKAYDFVTWDDSDKDEHIEKYLRLLIINRACKWGHRHCIEKATSLFQQWMADEKNNPISPNLRHTVYCEAIKAGGAAEWDFAYRMYQKNYTEYIANEKMTLGRQLSCTRRPWILRNLIRLAEAKKDTGAIQAIARNPVGLPIVWDYLKMNWNNWTTGINRWNILRVIISRYSTQYYLDEFIQFTKEYPDHAKKPKYPKMIEKIKSNIEWMEKNQEPIENWFKAMNANMPMEAPPGLQIIKEEPETELGEEGETVPDSFQVSELTVDEVEFYNE